MKYVFLILAFILVSCSSIKKKNAVATEVGPEVVFEVTQGILHPESIIYSPKHEKFFVSNVSSGNPLETKSVGYLSKISKDGKIVTEKWITGFKAPKGIAIVGDDLYVTDINRVVKVSISKAKIAKVFPLKNAKFLNDVTADNEGNIYISDTLSDIIYRIKDNKIDQWLKDDRVAGSHGLYTDGKEHIIATKWGADVDPKTLVAKGLGDIAVISLKNQNEITVVKDLQGQLDGIAVDGKGTLWISDWITGNVFTMTKQGKVSKMFNLGQGTADISVARELGLLLVPQMLQNKILFIKL